MRIPEPGAGSSKAAAAGAAVWRPGCSASGEEVREIDSPTRPARRMGKKTDDLDAVRVAREAIGREDLATPRDTGDRDALAALLVARRSAVEMTGDTERQLVSLAATCPEPLAVRLRGKTTAQIVDTCIRWRPAGGTSIAAVAEAMRSLARRIRSLRAEATAPPSTHSRTSSSVGDPTSSDSSESAPSSPRQPSWCGPIPAASAARQPSPCSQASPPIPASSGMTNRHRLNRRGDRHLNCAIHVVALHRQRHDAATKAYFETPQNPGQNRP